MQKEHVVKTQKQLPANRHNIGLPANVQEEAHLNQPVTGFLENLQQHVSNGQPGNVGQIPLPMEQPPGFAAVSDITCPFLLHICLRTCLPWHMHTSNALTLITKILAH